MYSVRILLVVTALIHRDGPDELTSVAWLHAKMAYPHRDADRNYRVTTKPSKRHQCE